MCFSCAIVYHWFVQKRAFLFPFFATESDEQILLTCDSSLSHLALLSRFRVRESCFDLDVEIYALNTDCILARSCMIR